MNSNFCKPVWQCYHQVIEIFVNYHSPILFFIEWFNGVCWRSLSFCVFYRLTILYVQECGLTVPWSASTLTLSCRKLLLACEQASSSSAGVGTRGANPEEKGARSCRKGKKYTTLGGLGREIEREWRRNFSCPLPPPLPFALQRFFLPVYSPKANNIFSFPSWISSVLKAVLNFFEGDSRYREVKIWENCLKGCRFDLNEGCLRDIRGLRYPLIK